MKRLIALILLCLMLLPGCAAKGNQDTAPIASTPVDPTGYKVAAPLAYPDYTFQGTPTNEELRATAVRAMYNLLTIQWSTATEIQYNKTGPVSWKIFNHKADTTYGGVMYSSASAGLFQFMEFYDQETGRMYYPDGTSMMKKKIGASCADAVIWSWNTVCTSIEGLYYPNTMVYANGFLPVGDYTYDYSIKNFSFLPTVTIKEQNDKAVIMASYAQVLPADGLVSSTDDHAMMAIAPAHVVYNSDGSINTAESYITIQDQRAGEDADFYKEEIDGQLLLLSGRTHFDFSFDELYKRNFIPVAPAEIQGTKKYESAVVTCTEPAPNTLNALIASSIESNYPLALVNAYLVYPDGGKVLLERDTFSGDNRSGVPKSYSLSSMKRLVKAEFLDTLKVDNTYYVEIEAVAANGTRHIPVRLRIDK